MSIWPPTQGVAVRARFAPMHKAPLPRLRTGIPGLDVLVGGGLIEGSSTIIQGRPGSGKTILANQIAFHHARQGGRVLCATVLAEPHERLFQFLSTLTFFDPERVGDDIQYVSAFDTLRSAGLAGVVALLRREIIRHRATLMLVDGLLTARGAAESALDTKMFVAELQGHAAFAGCGVLFLTSAMLDEGSPEHTMVDGVIELAEQIGVARSSRWLTLRKTRGSAAIGGRHEFEIGTDGVVVHPRLEAVLGFSPEAAEMSNPSPEELTAQLAADCATPRMSVAIGNFDRLLGGGLPCGSGTLIASPSGGGKTLTGLCFLAGSTLAAPGLMVGFFEPPVRLVRKGEAVGLPIAALAGSGALRFLHCGLAVRSIDAIGQEILAAVFDYGIKRIVIDSAGALFRIASNPSRVVEFFFSLTTVLRQRGVTVLTTWETPEMTGSAQTAVISTDAASGAQGCLWSSQIYSSCDNLLGVHFDDRGGLLRRILRVQKMRDSQYDPQQHELQIATDGLRLVATTAV